MANSLTLMAPRNYQLGPNDFLASETGQIILARRRFARRLYLHIDGIEPRGKASMPIESAAALRQQLHIQLARKRRRPYRRDVVLQIRVQTTERNPSHIHTIAKNILDLLGSTTAFPQPLLYRDDRQICGLAVTCEHGTKNPSICISSRSIADFRTELSIANVAPEYFHRRDQYVGFHRALSASSELAETQRRLLGRARINERALARLLWANEPHWPLPDEILGDFSRAAEGLVIDHPFRITLTAPPSQGMSQDYRHRAKQSVEKFRKDFQAMLTPLVVPVGLEVIVKPPARAQPQSLQDLDNLLRRYLIPAVVNTFQPPSHFTVAMNREARGAHVGAQPPKSAEIGLIRMEAWRVPRMPADSSPGFVSLALVADEFGNNDSISSTEGLAGAWIESLD